MTKEIPITQFQNPARAFAQLGYLSFVILSSLGFRHSSFPSILDGGGWLPAGHLIPPKSRGADFHHFNSDNRRATSPALARRLKALMRKQSSPSNQNSCHVFPANACSRSSNVGCE
jgi:hypothetical protein